MQTSYGHARGVQVTFNFDDMSSHLFLNDPRATTADGSNPHRAQAPSVSG
jgi:hypothetical protein